MSLAKRKRASWRTIWDRYLGVLLCRKRHASRLKLRFEPLEQRHLLATFVVGNTTDVHLTGQLNIREAIAAATATVEDDVIELAPSSVHQLNSQLTINVNSATNGKLIIKPSSGTATIDAGQNGRVVQIVNGTIQFDKVVFRNGALTTSDSSSVHAMDGAGILNNGNLTLSLCTVQDNISRGYGGGIFSDGTLSLDGCSVSNNSASYAGGGMDNVGFATIANSTITRNSANDGSGIALRGSASSLILASSVVDNRGLGGGVFATETSVTKILSSTIARNELQATKRNPLSSADSGLGAGLAVHSSAIAEVTQTTIANNRIVLDPSIDGAEGNGSVSAAGAGVYVQSFLRLTQSTIANNVVITNDGRDTGIDGVGLYSIPTAYSVVRNSLIVGNGVQNHVGVFRRTSDAYGNVNQAESGFNLIGSVLGSPLVHGVNGNIVGKHLSEGIVQDWQGIEVVDGAIGDFGGGTSTLALVVGSPAIDAGNNAFATLNGQPSSAMLVGDQRGAGFSRTQNATVDIGALEGVALPIVQTSLYPTTIAENGGEARVFVILSQPATQSLSVVLSLSDNIAFNDSGTIEIAAGETSGSVAFHAIDGAINETNRSFGVAITSMTPHLEAAPAVPLNGVILEENHQPTVIGETLPKFYRGSFANRRIPFDTLTANDSPGSSGESYQKLTVVSVGNSVGLVVAIDGTDVIATPIPGFIGTASFSYEVADNGTTHGVSDPKSATGTVSFPIIENDGDFGDAPFPYPTTYQEDGARHIGAGPKLGLIRDINTGTHSFDASDDGVDEDGVTFGPIRVGALGATASVTVTGAALTAKLDAWIDFNGDGNWGGVGENIATSVEVVDGVNTISFDVPPNAQAGVTFARFRLSTAGSLGFVGEAADGEVEDYAILVNSPTSTVGAFSSRRAVSSSLSWPDGVSTADLDGDGDMDILCSSSREDRVAWLENNGNLTFTSHLISAVAYGAKSVSAVDIDRDGDLDVLVALFETNQIVWYQNDGERNFLPHTLFASGDGPIRLSTVDVDSDGDLDVFVSSFWDDKITWYENDGSQVFTAHVISSTADGAIGIDIADVDRDGDLDIVCASALDDQISWYENDGRQAFTAHIISAAANDAVSAWAADMDRDGDIDVVSASRGDNKIAWYENDGSQSFVTHIISTTPLSYPVSTRVADLDGDGDQDVVSVSQQDRRIAWYENGINQIFISHQIDIIAPTFDPSWVDVSDLDGDGDLDVLTAADGYGINWYSNGSAGISVDLRVNSPLLIEQSGIMSVMATISTITSQNVVVTLTFTGSATLNSDYSASGVSITIPAGQTSGSITLTGLNDFTFEGDESVVVDVTSVTGGTENGTQQVTATIVDDDSAPSVTLALAPSSMVENSGTATVTARLSNPSTQPVTVQLDFTGSATSNSDYSPSGVAITIPAGQTSGSITLTGVNDFTFEGTESVVVDVTSVTGGTENGAQQVTLSIADDETPATFVVSALTPTATGFTALFNRTFVASALNLYTTQALAAASDVTLTGSVSGAVRGSIVINAAGDGFTFVATAGLLASNQTYTVTLRSGADAFQDSLGGLLDGNADGTSGDNYSTTFNVAAPSGDRRTLSLPNFARGFGQDINLPASGATGIPVTLSDGTGVQSVDFDLAFDPALLTITNVTVAAGITGNVSFNTSTTGLLRVSYFSSGSLPTGSTSFLNITADVPDNAPYSAKHVLDLRNININEGTIASIDDDAVHVAAYLGDATGNRGYSGLDASLISRVVVGLDTGHAAYPMLDPVILSDVTANGGLSGLDASLVAQKVVGLTVTQIPALPALQPPAGGGPDPKLYIPQTLSGQIGQTITVPLMLDVTDAGGIALQAGDYALSFDQTKFSVANARLGTLDASGFGISANVNNTLGTITVSTFATGSPVNLSFGTSGSVVLLDFTVLAGAALGSSPIDLENDIGGTFTSLNEGGLTLIPAPTNNANDPVDGLFTIQGNTPDVALSVSSASLSENGGSALVIATLTQTTSQTVTVNLALSGSATNNVDYNLSATTITIPAGQLSAAITVTGVNDATFEGNESLVIDIASATNANENGVQQVAVTITDDDTAPLVNLAVSPSSFGENGGTTTVTARLTNPSTQAVTINLSFSGAATSGVDYSASATTITIPAGSTAGSITLTGLNDFTFEGNESLVVDISNVTGGSENNTQQVTATITDDESAPLVNLTLASNMLAENGGTATVTATLTNPSTQAVTINLVFSGAATSGVDYSASATTITIPAGSTAGSITLTGLNDLTYENDESLVVDISTVTGGSENGTQQVTATISDDDSAPSVQFQLANSSANEAAGNVTIVVTLSAPSAMATSVSFTLGGTATNVDRTVSASPLVIAAGQTSAAIVVSVINDSLDELNESVVLQLGTPTNATLGASTTHTLTIVDNDAPPVVQFTTLSQSVNESTPTATAIIRLTQPSGLDVTVPITVSGSATSADASVSSTLPVTIPAGQTSAAITVAISDDTAAEPTETFVLTIGTPTNATRGAVSAHTVSILDNDSTVAVQLAGSNFNVGEASGSVPLSATLSTFALQPITVPLILSGSADGQDYRLSTTSVTIPAGQTRAIVTLTVTDDQRDELPETLTIQLGTPIGGELGTNTALTVTIDDNDPVLSFVRSSDTTSDESGTITVIARSLSPVIADLTVPFTSYGSATLGVDYTLSANAFQFLAGASTAAVTLTIVDDAVVESSEAVTLSLQPPPNTSLGSPGLYTLFISDNDTPPAVGLDLNGLATGQDFLSPVGEFVEDAAALVIVPNATVVPPGVQTLTSLTVYLESAPNGAAESLTAVNSGGATATAYNPSTRSLTISGGTTSDQQAVLRSVAYQNSSQNPTAGGRFVTVTANFSASTESRRRKLNVTPVDDAPVVTITAGTPTYVTGNAPLIVDAGVALSDIENNRLVRAEVTITDAESGDVLSLSSPVAGFTSTFTGNVLTITANAGSGNLAAFRSALSRVQFSTTTIGDGNRSVSFIVTDTSGLTGIAGATSAPAVRALTVQSPLLVAASPLNSAAAHESLTPSQLVPLVHEALARWESAGATAAQLNVLRAATIEIRDLADPRTLALAGGSTITLDNNAAGRGWFLDSTPSTDEEFSIPLTTSAARAATGPAVDRVDLLTTILHEYGHLLGLDDHLGSTDLLAESLPLGTRRNLTAVELSHYFTHLGS